MAIHHYESKRLNIHDTRLRSTLLHVYLNINKASPIYLYIYIIDVYSFLKSKYAKLRRSRLTSLSHANANANDCIHDLRIIRKLQIDNRFGNEGVF